MANPAAHTDARPAITSADSAADRHATTDGHTPANTIARNCAYASADGNASALAHSATDSDPRHVSAYRHTSANCHTATRADASAHYYSPADIDAVQFRVDGYRNADSFVGRCLLGHPQVRGAAGHSDWCRHCMGL